MLDNPIWHALTGPQAFFGTRRDHAARFAPDVAPFFAIDATSPAAYGDLAALIDEASEARLFRPSGEPVPPGWSATFEKEIVQMVCAGAPSMIEAPLVELGPNDADMSALAAVTHPGPFAARTATLGRFAGIRVGGALIAMAGERLRLPAHVELSAICTHPDHRGRGHARALVAHLCVAALARGETPFLHVFPDNPAALLYRALGFVERRRLLVRWLVPRVS
jgi:ribosomal protein S18 acetylase RimI-like enzyme